MKPEFRWRIYSKVKTDSRNFMYFILSPHARGAYSYPMATVYGLLRIPAIALLSTICALFIFYPIIQATNLAAPKDIVLMAPWWQVILFVPFIEEMIFRFGLRQLHAYFYLLATVFILFLLVLVFPYFAPFLPYFIASIALICLLYALCAKRRSTSLVHARQYKKLLPYSVHFSCAIFALIHLFNYRPEQFTSENWLLAPFLVLPQYAFAWLLSWIRLQSGIFAAFLLHASYNGLIYVIVHFFS